ncbi:unnamed protein product, partial [Nesidiocoris tenuis]
MSIRAGASRSLENRRLGFVSLENEVIMRSCGQQHEVMDPDDGLEKHGLLSAVFVIL